METLMHAQIKIVIGYQDLVSYAMLREALSQRQVLTTVFYDSQFWNINHIQKRYVTYTEILPRKSHKLPSKK